MVNSKGDFIMALMVSKTYKLFHQKATWVADPGFFQMNGVQRGKQVGPNYREILRRGSLRRGSNLQTLRW